MLFLASVQIYYEVDMSENAPPASGADSESATPPNVIRVAQSVTETAKAVGVCKQTIYNEINAGHLIAHKLRGRTLILPDDRRAWLAALPIMETEGV